MTLRIQRSVESKLVVFKLAGRIRAEDVPGLLALLRSESPGSGVLMDLTDVKLVDRECSSISGRERGGRHWVKELLRLYPRVDHTRESVMSRNRTEHQAGLAE
jgi:hypothetical protein